MSVIALLLTVLSAGCPAKPESAEPTEEQKPLIAFLVRHAEKELGESKDPELSEAGKKRAVELVRVLGSAGIENIHSSDFKRTRNTAAPIASETGAEVELYDPDDLAALAKKLRRKGGRHLVIGHSNTTPELAKLLGGDAGTKIDEKGEYDRLYVVSIGKDGTVNSVIMRFGEAFEAEKAEEKAAEAAV